jgi:hypothetical protein
MTPAQKKAVEDYRERQKEKGLVRVEVNVPNADRLLIKRVAESLRAGGEKAMKTRSALSSILNPYEGMNLKELLENAPPLDELDLERSKETARDIDL